MIQPPVDPPEMPVLTLLPSQGESGGKRSKGRSKARRADRTQREQELLDLLASLKRNDRRTADAIAIVVESVAKSPGNNLVQAVCRVVDFANKNRRAR
jgi:hypothetical protein